jgi:hypothetical protein
MREGPTTVCVKNFNYTFFPIPGSLEGEMTTSVCNVPNIDVVEYLIGDEKKGLKGRGNFRPYKPEQAMADLDARRKEIAKRMGQMSGYSIQPVRIGETSKGYAVFRRTVENGIQKTEICGANGIWTTDPLKVMAFTELVDADTWLHAFVDNQPLPEMIPVRKYMCAEIGCRESFDTPRELLSHYEEKHEASEESPVASKQPASAIPPLTTPTKGAVGKDGEDVRYNHTPAEGKK